MAIIGSLLNTRYKDNITAALLPYHVPHAIMTTIGGSIGGGMGAELAQAARSAFISGMDLGLATGAGVAGAGALLALLWLPRWQAARVSPAAGDDTADTRARDHRP